MKNYGQRSIIFYRRQQTKPFKRGGKCKKGKLFEEALKSAEERK